MRNRLFALTLLFGFINGGSSILVPTAILIGTNTELQSHVESVCGGMLEIGGNTVLQSFLALGGAIMAHQISSSVNPGLVFAGLEGFIVTRNLIALILIINSGARPWKSLLHQPDKLMCDVITIAAIFGAGQVLDCIKSKLAQHNLKDTSVVLHILSSGVQVGLGFCNECTKLFSSIATGFLLAQI